MIVVAHPRVAADADPSTSDVLDQVELVTGALAALGEQFETVAVDGGRVWEAVAPRPGVVVFNLLEAPPGSPQLQPAATAALELLGLPFTGSAAATMWLTTVKLATRALLASHGLPVPAGGRFDPVHPTLLVRCLRPGSPSPRSRTPRSDSRATRCARRSSGPSSAVGGWRRASPVSRSCSSTDLDPYNRSFAYYITGKNQLVSANVDGHTYYRDSDADIGVDYEGFRVEPMWGIPDPKRRKYVKEIWFDLVSQGDFYVDVYWRGGETAAETAGEPWTQLGTMSHNNPSRAVVYCARNEKIHQIKWRTELKNERFQVNGITFKYTMGSEIS